MKRYIYTSFISVFIALVFALFLGNSAQAATEKNINYNGTRYFVTETNRRAYSSETAFLSYGFNNINSVSIATELDMALPEGVSIPPRDGSVICSNSSFDKGTCYLITNGQKAPIQSLAVLKSWGFSAKNIPSADISALRTAEAVTDPNREHRAGTLINRAGTLYLVGKSGLLAFPNQEVLSSWGYSISDAIPANNADSLLQQITWLETRQPGELVPYEPVIPAPLQLTNEDKFILPFAGTQLPKINEAWLYSAQERSIHGFANHGGIDFDALRGTPVYAAADGYALSSSHYSPLNRTYQDKTPVGFGLGEFVQIWHPKQGVYSSYSHLHKVEDKIPYYKPECDETKFCNPVILYNLPETIEDKGVFIKKGTLIGHIGDSGLGLGYDEQPRGGRLDPKDYPSWDETHLHFEIYTRDPIKFTKSSRFDPFGIYGRVEQYNDSSFTGPISLWQVDKDGKPVFAKD